MPNWIEYIWIISQNPFSCPNSNQIIENSLKIARIFWILYKTPTKSEKEKKNAHSIIPVSFFHFNLSYKPMHNTFPSF